MCVVGPACLARDAPRLEIATARSWPPAIAPTSFIHSDKIVAQWKVICPLIAKLRNVSLHELQVHRLQGSGSHVAGPEPRDGEGHGMRSSFGRLRMLAKLRELDH